MVKGLELFRDYFADYTDQYVLIGGAACDVSFEKSGAEFRATRDLDVVLILEALTEAFGRRFWKFVERGKYRRRERGDGHPQFYRFDRPETPEYPAMIELFSRSGRIPGGDAVLTPVHIDDSVSSLSAILLDDVYYRFLLEGRAVMEEITVLKPTWLIPFKAKAWFDLNEKLSQGRHVDSRDIKKHRNDIIRIAAELVLEPCRLPEAIQRDMQMFIERLQVTQAELKSLGITGVRGEDLTETLKSIYHLSEKTP